MKKASNQNVPTPWPFVMAVEKFFNIKFEYDLAASEENKKAPLFFSEAQDSLTIDWPRKSWCWLNPPYRNLTKWINKCVESRNKSNIITLWPLSGDKNMIPVFENADVYIISGRIFPQVRSCMLCVWNSLSMDEISCLNWDKKLEELTFLWEARKLQ